MIDGCCGCGRSCFKVCFKIEIAVDDHISFRISNHINTVQNLNKDKVGGVGLNNVYRRLDLLYPGKHLIEIFQEDDLFRVELSLKSQP